MDRSLFFLIAALGCVWLVLDEFYGNRLISLFVSKIATEPYNPQAPHTVAEPKKDADGKPIYDEEYIKENYGSGKLGFWGITP